MKLAIVTILMTLALGGSANAGGFGTDLIFGNLITTPQLLAPADCPDFGFTAGQRLVIFAQADHFAIQDADGQWPINIAVPADGDYVYFGESPNRITNEIISQSQGIRAVMDARDASIRVGKFQSPEQPCLLTRCPAFGPCN